eukprot:CAMPEP_0114545614 /NCGR_PEP_ID=MMETSP0114-20121206/3502_1 /TAXON_ID=31324 /ORGANISM="Goniomonas sp, Strain m" /LENGTH=223 /DNA_ID=CAMNT_0001730069 /DNA_START=26 /DNA_END=697 /DNA_ORIENTATION=+
MMIRGAAAAVMMQRKRDAANGGFPPESETEKQDKRLANLARDAERYFQKASSVARAPPTMAAFTTPTGAVVIARPLSSTPRPRLPERMLMDSSLEKRSLYFNVAIGGWSKRYFVLTNYRLYYISEFNKKPPIPEAKWFEYMSKQAFLSTIEDITTEEIRMTHHATQKGNRDCFGITLFFSNQERWLLRAKTKNQAKSWHQVLVAAWNHAREFPVSPTGGGYSL